MRAFWRTFMHQVRVRPRLISSVIFGLLLCWLLPQPLAPVTRALLAWDAGAALYLILALSMMGRANLQHMRARAEREDDGALAVLLLALFAGLASVAAIVAEMSGVKAEPAYARELHFILMAITLLCSWTFVHTCFALHYAHEYYAPHRDPALDFPHSPEPDYWDFMYFSFVIGTTSQTADVNIVSRTMRRLALLHGVVAFFFNTTLLALVINIAAGLL